MVKEATRYKTLPSCGNWRAAMAPEGFGTELRRPPAWWHYLYCKFNFISRSTELRRWSNPSHRSSPEAQLKGYSHGAAHLHSCNPLLIRSLLYIIIKLTKACWWLWIFDFPQEAGLFGLVTNFIDTFESLTSVMSFYQDDAVFGLVNRVLKRICICPQRQPSSFLQRNGCQLWTTCISFHELDDTYQHPFSSAPTGIVKSCLSNTFSIVTLLSRTSSPQLSIDWISSFGWK